MAIAVLLGWVFEDPALKSILPSLPAMKPNTAIGRYEHARPANHCDSWDSTAAESA
jgi:hypothetical protein